MQEGVKLCSQVCAKKPWSTQNQVLFSKIRTQREAGKRRKVQQH